MNLIFVHGGPGLDEYLSEYFRNVKLDKGVLRFYQQLKGNSVTIEDLVSQLGEEIEAVGECTLVGHSWGGTLAIEYLKRTKDSRVKSLVLMNVPLSYDHWFEVYERHLGLAPIL